MNGRACQLCGKPLSRIWAGSGGDFCSREHRNQYRLRCGMDTLLEANKHASLMRRRDQLRHFPATSLQCNSDTAPRGSGTAPIAVRRPALRRMPPLGVLANAKIEPGEGRFLAPQALGECRGRLAAEPRLLEKAGLPSARRPTLPPARATHTAIALTRAQTASIPLKRSMGEGSSRDFASLPRDSRHPLLSARAFRALEVEGVGTITGKRPRTLAMAAKAGNAFRVSGNTAFRKPALRLGAARLAGPVSAGLQWPENVELAQILYGLRPAKHAQTNQAMPFEEVRLPASVKLRQPLGLHAAHPLPVGVPPAYECQLQARQSGWIWQAAAGQQAIPSPALQGGRAPVGPGWITLKLRPRGSAAESRVERSPFQPQERVWINAPDLWNNSR